MWPGRGGKGLMNIGIGVVGDGARAATARCIC